MDIAYHVFDGGPSDLLVLPGPFVPIDSIDDEPSMYRIGGCTPWSASRRPSADCFTARQ